MEEFPPNSHTNRDIPAVPAEAKKLPKVITGEVVRRKKPVTRRFAESFVNGDAKAVGGYILWDVMLPALKDTVADVATQAVERLLFGESRSTLRRTAGRGQVNYSRYSQATRLGYRENRPEQTRPPAGRRPARQQNDFEEIILQTRGEAEMVRDRLFDLVDRYAAATVSDLYDLLGITPDYTDGKWGWYNLSGLDIVRISSGYLLDLPQPESLVN